MKAYKKLCVRCHVRDYFAGELCPTCASHVADELYLDEGSNYQVQEETDRKVTGEYAEANEGDDDLSDQKGIID